MFHDMCQFVGSIYPGGKSHAVNHAVNPQVRHSACVPLRDSLHSIVGSAKISHLTLMIIPFHLQNTWITFYVHDTGKMQCDGQITLIIEHEPAMVNCSAIQGEY